MKVSRLVVPGRSRGTSAQREDESPCRSAPRDHASRWPRRLRRGPMEFVASCVIGTGVLMLLQPFALPIYTYSFVTTLAGTAMFIVVSKFPD